VLTKLNLFSAGTGKFPHQRRNRRKRLPRPESQAVRQLRTFVPVENHNVKFRENRSRAISAQLRFVTK
jgi:hypothetical protein